MKITLAQLNPTVGDIPGNVAKMRRTLDEAIKASPDLVVFSELVVTGYPPKDLLDRPAFIDQATAAVEEVTALSKRLPGAGVIFGAPVPTGLNSGKPLYNAAILVAEGRVLCRQPKMLLPTYDVFDELRHFRPGDDNVPFEFKGVKLGLSICEDLWFEPDRWNRRPYDSDPIGEVCERGAELIINISASPFSVGKEKVRYELIRKHTIRHGAPFILVNQVGGNDDLVFDGRSLYVDQKGDARVVMPSFEEKVLTIDTDDLPAKATYVFEDALEAVYKGLLMGTRDYVRKCGLSNVIIGLSGGVDSAVTAALAVRALGAGNVTTLAMPSPYSSPASLEDARVLARNLGVEFKVIAIDGLMTAYDRALKDEFRGTQEGVAEENIQARIRGNLLMALANKFGYLPLSTGNKSELAVGYCTLYGDMSGGLAVISDVPKTMVYRLAERINRDGEMIPRRTIEREPSAELKPNQRDVDSLPPYDVLDGILECYIDQYLSLDRIVEKGFDRKTVAWVIDAIRKNEYKRKQAAPGIKVTSKAFGSGRRMPIAAKFDA